MYDLDKQIGIHVMGDRPDITDASAVKPSACVEYYLGYEAPCATSKVINEAKGNE